MAYVVSRPNGRFEIRESVHTPKGPRARSLANFSRLTDGVLSRAGTRATRPFDASAVLVAARRVGAPLAPTVGVAGAFPAVTSPPVTSPPMERFVASSRRMARSLEARPAAARRDPGDALIDLLGFVEQLTPFVPDRPTEPLRFPPLSHLVEERRSRVGEPRRK